MVTSRYASNLYSAVMLQGMGSQEIWVVSLEFMVGKLRAAKQARSLGDYEGAYQCHDRILSVLAILHTHGKEAPQHVEAHMRAEVEAGNAAILAFYDRMRRVISSIAVRPDADARYDALIKQTLALCARLRANANQPYSNGILLSEPIQT